MTSDAPLSPARDGAMNYVCAPAVIGWLWYCDNHETHGNADSQDEAEVYAEAHYEYFARGQDGKPCDVIVWLRTPHEHSKDAAATP